MEGDYKEGEGNIKCVCRGNMYQDTTVNHTYRT